MLTSVCRYNARMDDESGLVSCGVWIFLRLAFKYLLDYFLLLNLLFTGSID